MDIVFLNGSYQTKEETRISPDDRGFLFGDGVYEVMKWYGGFFFDPESHQERLKRSLRELRINWKYPDTFISISSELIRRNKLEDHYALVYFQVTRGASPRSHSFPEPEVTPTVYAFARATDTSVTNTGPGVAVMLKKDIRWSRCDIKSIALLANIISFQEAYERGMKECIFERDGFITEGSRSNIFLVEGGTIYTHPESEYILSGISRKNVLRFAREAGLEVREEPYPVGRLDYLQEAFITNTSAEITPVIEIGGVRTGDGIPGQVTSLLIRKFIDEISSLKGR